MFHFYNIILLVILLSVSNWVLSKRIPPYIKHNASILSCNDKPSPDNNQTLPLVPSCRARIFHEKTIYFEDAPPIKVWIPDSWTEIFYKIVDLTKLRIRNYRAKDILDPHDIKLTMPKLFVDDMNNIFMLFT
jgi:hypothetical protein